MISAINAYTKTAEYAKTTERYAGKTTNLNNVTNVNTQGENEYGVSFLDIFKNIVSNANETQLQKQQDAIDSVLGNVDDVERIQANITKAEVALELLVNVKNGVVDAYNEIFRMSV